MKDYKFSAFYENDRTSDVWMASDVVDYKVYVDLAAAGASICSGKVKTL